jgi:hypothetical protein
LDESAAAYSSLGAYDKGVLHRELGGKELKDFSNVVMIQ